MEISNPDINIEPKLIGREDELHRLIRIFNDVRNKNGSTVFISGEAGIGKTRLVQEFKKSVEEKDDVRFIQGSCLHESMEPLSPITQALRDADLEYLMSQEDPPEVISSFLIANNGLLVADSERERSGLEGDIFAPMLDMIVNFVGDTLSEMGREEENNIGLNTIEYGDYKILVQTGKEFSLANIIQGDENEYLLKEMRETLTKIEKNFESWNGNMNNTAEAEEYISHFTESDEYKGEYLVDDPEIKQENLFENILLSLKDLASDKKVILFLDDLQWADKSTLLFLHYLARNTQNDNVMIIGTYRPEDIMRIDERNEHQFKKIKQNMNREGLFEEIKLERLSLNDSDKMITSILRSKEIEDNFTEKIYQDTEGNPFFILEILQLLEEENYIIIDDGKWKLDKDIEYIDLPSRINDLITRRTDRLSEEQRRILSCASVEGEKFSSKIIENVLDLDRIDLLEQLNKIENYHNLIHTIEEKYTFLHGNIREVLYNKMNKDLRKEYHKRIAETYEEIYDKDEHIEKIGFHFCEAEDKRGIEYLIDAGENAQERYANEEAISFYRKSLHLIDDNAKKYSEVNTNLGELYNTIGKYEKSLEKFRCALENIEKKDDKIKIYSEIAENFRDMGSYNKSIEYANKGIELTEKDDIKKGRLMKEKGWAYLRLGEYDKAEKNFEKEKELSERLDDTSELYRGYYGLGTVFYFKGDYEISKKYYENAIDIADQIGDIKKLSSCYSNLALIYSIKGEKKKSLEYNKKSLEMSKKIGNKKSIAISYNNLGNIHSDMGNIEKALDYLEKGLEIRKETGEKFGMASSYNSIGDIYLNQGKLDEALNYQKKALDLSREIGNKKSIAISLNNIGDVYFEKGEENKAITNYQKSLEIKKETGRKKSLVVSLCRISNALIKKGKIKKAKEKTERAINISLDIDAKEGEGMSKRLLGMIYRDEKKWDQAIKIFNESIDILEKCGNERKLSKVYYELGILLKKKEDRQIARANLEKALKIFDNMNMKIWIDRANEVLKSL